MRDDLYDFDLPEENIALRPVSPREAAKLLVVQPDRDTPYTDRTVGDLPSLLRAGDALVFNDTRVIPAQLEGIRHREGAGGQKVSATLHMRTAGDRWKAFAKPGKRIKLGDRITFGDDLSATVEQKGEGGEVTLHFDASGPELDRAIAMVGHIPLPPYIASTRAEDELDRKDYQPI